MSKTIRGRVVIVIARVLGVPVRVRESYFARTYGKCSKGSVHPVFALPLESVPRSVSPVARNQ